MNKQELIDKAVEDLKGVLRNHKDYWFENGEMWLYFPEGSFDRLQLCTTEEFTTSARELGWINGYKWGVEYQTNGKKPDLPNDALIEWENRIAETGTNFSGRLDWKIGKSMEVVKFRIVDERYKPKEPESQGKPSVDGATNTTEFGKKDFPQDYSFIVDGAKGKPEKSWHERGELPPIGAECEYLSGDKWFKVEITYRSDWLICFKHLLNGDPVELAKDAYSDLIKKSFRPIKTEREKFVEAALSAADKFKPECDITFAQALYDAGFRAPD